MKNYLSVKYKITAKNNLQIKHNLLSNKNLTQKKRIIDYEISLVRIFNCVIVV